MQSFEAVIDFLVYLISRFSTREIAFGCAFGILVVSLILYLVVVLRPHLRFMRSVRSAIAAIRSARANSSWSVDDRLAAVGKALAKNDVVGLAWWTYRRGLRENPAKQGDRVNPVDPYAWFSIDRLPGRGYEKWASTLAGVFLTVGLLFTFVGLTAALFRVGEAGADTAQLRLAISEILRISSAKFVTSMAGIIAYIGWTLVARLHGSSQSKVVLEFASQVQSLTTPVTPEALLLDHLEQAREQTSRMKTLADDLAVAFDASLDKVVGQHVGALPAALGEVMRPALELSVKPVVDAITGMGTSIGAGNHAALEEMISSLATEVRESTGREMGLLGEAMRQAADELKAAQADAAVAREHAQGELSPILVELKGLMGEIRMSVEESRGALVAGGRAAADDLAAALAGAGEVLSGASARASDALVQTFEASTSRMVSSVDDALSGYREATTSFADRLGEVERSLSALDVSVGRNVSQLEETKGGLQIVGRTLGSAGDNMERAAAPVLATLKSLEAASVSTRDALVGMQNSSRAIEASSVSLKSCSDAAVLAFGSYEKRFAGVDASLGQTIAKLSDGVVNLGHQVTEVVSKQDTLLAKAVGHLRSGVEDLSDALEGIGSKLGEAAD